MAIIYTISSPAPPVDTHDFIQTRDVIIHKFSEKPSFDRIATFSLAPAGV